MKHPTATAKPSTFNLQPSTRGRLPYRIHNSRFTSRLGSGFAALCIATLLLASAKADVLVGTYQINYRYNDGGLPDGAPDRFNPFLNDQGAIHVTGLAPGTYYLQSISNGPAGGGAPSAWVGNASAGTHSYINSTPGSRLGLALNSGEIVLYYDDWVVFDNDPNIWTEVALYRAPATFADFVTFQDGVDPERASGQLAGVGFTLECTRRVHGGGSGIGNGGVVSDTTTNGTSTLFSSTNFMPALAVGDDVSLGGASDFRLTFSQPVANLTLHLYQLADNTLSFTTTNGIPAAFALLSSDGDLTVASGGTAIRGICACGAPGGSDNASGSLFFPGTFTELRWTSDSANMGDGYRLQLSVSGSPRADLRSSIRVSSVDVSWSGSTNWLYQVQYSSDLTSNSWQNLGAPVQGNGTNRVTDPVNGSERRFYRVIDAP